MFNPQTIFYPFDKSHIDLPKDHQKTLFLGAENTASLQQFSHLSLWQFYKRPAQELVNAGYELIETLPVKDHYDYALCALPKQAVEAQYFLALAASSIKDQGILLAAAANDAGGGRIEGWFDALGLAPQSLSKNKGRIVWAVKQDIQDSAQQWLEQGAMQEITLNGTAYMSQPGLFNWNEIDQGSQLLAEYIPEDLNGHGADFGCGFGYLSVQLLKKCPDIMELDCLDHDMRAVECCTRNLQHMNHRAKIFMHWHDLRQPSKKLKPLDFIVMNPPFHTGKKTDPDLGQKFIENAAYALKSGGRLYMVANTHLPYEKILRDKFSGVRQVAEENGFKIIEAQAQ